MQCKHCGATVEEEASFCDQCGKPVREAPQQPAAAQSPIPVLAKVEPAGPQPAARPLPKKRARSGAPEAIISHWSVLIEGLQTSPMGFYASVREAIERRELPDTEMALVEWPEGGAFSAKRVYLRVRRKDHVFDICGAPFAKSFFVSWWLGEHPETSLFYPFFIVVLTGLVGAITTYHMELLRALMVTAGAFLLVLVLLWRPTLEVIDHCLLRLPYVGPVYERFFRPLTYYRIDTALMFRGSVHAAVQEAIDRMTETQGLRALTELERKPVMREFLAR